MMTAETKSAKLKRELRRSGDELTVFYLGLTQIAELSPRTLTLGQMTFFLTAAMSDFNGRAATFTEIRDTVGPVIGKSLHTTYKVFLDETRQRSDQDSPSNRLGWLFREEDPMDNRRKYLRLTEKGYLVMQELAVALTEQKKLN